MVDVDVGKFEIEISKKEKPETAFQYIENSK